MARGRILKRVLAVLGVAFVALLVWEAAGPNPVPIVPLRVRATPPVVATRRILPTARYDRSDTPPPMPSKEPAVPADVLAPIAPATVTTSPMAGAGQAAVPVTSTDAPRPMIIPVTGVAPTAIHDMFNEVRGNHRHEAIDIMAPRGTPVIATDDGIVKKLFTSVPGGLTVYQFDPDERYCYYYAHLDGYAAGLHEGQLLHRGDTLGYVGTTGNAPPETPHLHFALIRLDPDKRWWKGTYVDPYPLLTGTPGR
jgi:peptidoglycan LD-endopeptidase LytH